jgi:hypothetical protein
MTSPDVVAVKLDTSAAEVALDVDSILEILGPLPWRCSELGARRMLASILRSAELRGEARGKGLANP